MTDSILKEKTVILTGAGSGIGRELALEFSRNGANVICVGRRADKLEETAALIKTENGTALVVPADVTLRKDVGNLVNVTLEKFGRIDILFNNAGSFKSLGPLWEADPDLWWRDVQTNLFGTMLCCRMVLPHMIVENSGIIINMDGGGGTPGPNIGGSAYGSSKAAILRLTEGLAGELKRINSQVMVFAINPGTVKTDMLNGILSQEDKKIWFSHIPKLLGTRDEAAPDACAHGTIELLKVATKALSGRVFHHDNDFAFISKNEKTIEKENLYVLKWVVLEGKPED